MSFDLIGVRGCSTILRSSVYCLQKIHERSFLQIVEAELHSAGQTSTCHHLSQTLDPELIRKLSEMTNETERN